MGWVYGEQENTIVVDTIPKRKKKITGTRFASVIGLNPYTSAFGAWCEIMGLAKLPFEGNKYTEAGNKIEPKQIAYVASMFPNVKNPEEYYGNIYDEMRYDFYKHLKVFGGMWDLVSTKGDNKTIRMIGECKTSSKPQDWQNNNVPIYYLCQGMLYAYLDKLSEILFIASFLQEGDYAHPDNYVVTEDNTKLIVKQLADTCIVVDGELCYIDTLVQKAQDWWETHVEGGVSPAFDEVKDKEYLDIIRKAQPINDDTLEGLCERAKNLVVEIDKVSKESGLDALNKSLKTIEANIKTAMLESLSDTETSTTCGVYTLKGSTTVKLDTEKLEKDYKKIYDSCCESTTTYKLTKDVKEKKEGK